MTKDAAECKIVACILAGGKARRLGGMAKGALEEGGVPIIERLIAELGRAGIEEVIIAANDPNPYRGYGRKIVADLRRDIGPLGGIEAALSYLKDRCDAVAFLPCDVPGITAAEIQVLIESFLAAGAPAVFAASGKNFWHPLCAVVHNGLLGGITAAIDGGERSVKEAWKRLGGLPVHFANEAAFFNINTPEDLEGWQTRCKDHDK